MRWSKALLIVLFLVGLARPVEAAVWEELQGNEQAQVVEIVDGDTLFLDREIEGSRQVRLVGIQAPKLPLGRKGFRQWPLAPDAKFALEELALDKIVTLKFGGARMDRYQRHLAHLFLEDGTWVQGALLERGMARVYTFADNRAVAEHMYEREVLARTAGRGIWAHPFYAVRPATPEALGNRIGTFQVIEGRVLDAAKVKGTVYLNFGENWRDDFTVVLNSKTRRLFSQVNLDPLQLKDKRVRVRGWLRRRNGPSVDASHPEQIEILEQIP